jgi:hypothetical protein
MQVPRGASVLVTFPQGLGSGKDIIYWTRLCVLAFSMVDLSEAFFALGDSSEVCEVPGMRVVRVGGVLC